MQRLIEDGDLTDSSVRSWKSVLPKLFKQIKLETVHNRRLRAATSDLSTLDDGMCMCVSCINNILHRLYLCYCISHETITNNETIFCPHRRYLVGSCTSAICAP